MSEQPWLAELKTVVPAERISVDPLVLEAHSYDTWPVATKWRQLGKCPHRAEVVVRPLQATEVSVVLTWASASGVPVTPWGAGSSVTGAALPVGGGISLDLSGLDRILVLDETNLLVKAQAGMMGHRLEAELNARGFTLNHSPQSLDRSTVGGWVATRATGQFSSRWGGIEDLVVSLTVALASGEVVETLFAPRAALGPDLRHLFIGAEGALGVVTDVTLKIAPLASARHFETLVFPTVESGLSAMRRIMQAGLRPFLLRLYDETESRFAMRNAQFAGNAMFLGCEGTPLVAEAEHATALAICEAEGGCRLGPDGAIGWMGRRFDFSTIENLLAEPGGVAETIEVAHFWSEIEQTYAALKAGLAPYAEHVLGHFSHAYPQGVSLYIILLGHAEDAQAAEERLLRIWQEAMRLALQEGAAISHHHGVGLARAPYMAEALGPAYGVLDRIKSALDPRGVLSPGKLGLPQRPRAPRVPAE